MFSPKAKLQDYEARKLSIKPLLSKSSVRERSAAYSMQYFLLAPFVEPVVLLPRSELPVSLHLATNPSSRRHLHPILSKTRIEIKTFYPNSDHPPWKKSPAEGGGYRLIPGLHPKEPSTLLQGVSDAKAHRRNGPCGLCIAISPCVAANFGVYC